MFTVYRHVLSQKLYRLVCRQENSGAPSAPMVMEEYDNDVSALHPINGDGYYSLRHLRPAFVK